MDGATVDAVIDDAVEKIRQLPSLTRASCVARLVRILETVHSNGYGYGLDQGHHDNENLAG